MNKFLKFLFTLLLVVFVLVWAFKQILPINHTLDASNKIESVMQFIEDSYVDTVNKDELIKAAINGMLQYLDPHSVYTDAIENKQFEESMTGEFEGVGIQFNIMNDTIMVIAAVSGGPSEKVGIKAGDRIVSVDGENVAGVGIDNNRVMKTLRGKKGTIVKIGIERPGVEQRLDFVVKRDVIHNNTITAPYMIDKTTGYIKMDQFGNTTASEFEVALLKLQALGMQKLILDLRGNAGGYLTSAITICDHLLADKETILSVEGRNTQKEVIQATRAGLFQTGDVVVLIDEFSASASEIVAGAIQDNDRGWVVGRRSFGKGLVQQHTEFDDGSSLRLTVSRYHTPSGRCIQRNYHSGTDAYYEDLVQRYENGEMDSINNIKFADSLKFYTKKGRVVYGGGGIMPDYFVGLDKRDYSPDYLLLINSPKLIEFTFDFAHKHETELNKKYYSPSKFVEEMNVTQAILDEYVRFFMKSDSKNMPKYPKLSAEEIADLKLWLKALIGRNLYQDEAFYPILNQMDNTIKKALELNGKP